MAGQVVSANGVGGSPTEVAAAYEASSRRRKVTIDGAEPERIGDAIGKLGAVIFSPADVGIVNEGPSRRRRFMDVALSLNEEGYLVALQAFRHALAQRNAALRSGQVEAVVRAWDDPLARSAAPMMRARHRWVCEWRDAFRRYYEEVSGGDSATMTYLPKVAVDVWDDDGIYEACRETLDGRWAVDLRRQNTSAGPHRDELLLTLVDGENEIEVREFGSGGQRRTVALAAPVGRGRCDPQGEGQCSGSPARRRVCRVGRRSKREGFRADGARPVRSGHHHRAQGKRRTPPGRCTSPVGHPRRDGSAREQRWADSGGGSP